MHQATCLSLTHEVWCRVKRTRSYNGDLITTFPFVTRWSHHFHTFLSDPSGRVWSYLIWLCSSRPGNLADDDMTSYVSVSTKVPRGLHSGLVRPIWIITLITRLSHQTDNFKIKLNFSNSSFSQLCDKVIITKYCTDQSWEVFIFIPYFHVIVTNSYDHVHNTQTLILFHPLKVTINIGVDLEWCIGISLH